jgi:hypothetical protein
MKKEAYHVDLLNKKKEGNIYVVRRVGEREENRKRLWTILS